MTKLDLAKTVIQDLFGQLREPFDFKRETKEHWKETFSTITTLVHPGSITHLVSKLCMETIGICADAARIKNIIFYWFECLCSANC
jgi:hypothetical protein